MADKVVFNKERTAPVSNGPVVTTATLKGNTLETVDKKNGEVLRRETRVLSTDQKQMTVTLLSHKLNGAKFKNVIVYETK
jgi:hypothetical protein